MVGQLSDGQAFTAQGAVADGGFGIPFHFNDPAVFDMSDDPAASMATPAGCPNLFYLFHSFPSLPGIGVINLRM